MAKQFHVEAGNVWDQALDQAVAQAVRSIERGQGPSQPKLPLRVQNLTLSSADVLFLHVWPRSRVELPKLRSLLARFWERLGSCLEASVASALCKDVTFNKARTEVRFFLPVSKTDTQAKGCVRSHVCICKLRHDDGCAHSSESSLLFTRLQKCGCPKNRHPLCSYHALLDMCLGP